LDAGVVSLSVPTEAVYRECEAVRVLTAGKDARRSKQAGAKPRSGLVTMWSRLSSALNIQT
jgi:hypothetical protein